MSMAMWEASTLVEESSLPPRIGSAVGALSL